MLLRVLLWYCVSWHAYAKPAYDSSRSQIENTSRDSTGSVDAKRQTIQSGGLTLPFPMTMQGNEAGQVGAAVPILLPNTIQNSQVTGIQTLEQTQVAPNVLQNPGQGTTVSTTSPPAASSPILLQMPNQQVSQPGPLQLQSPIQLQNPPTAIGTTLSAPSPCNAAPGQAQPLMLNPQQVGLPCNSPVPEQAPCGTPCNIVCNLPAPPPPPAPCNQEYTDHDDIHHHEYECLHKHHHYYHHHHVDDDDDEDRYRDHHNSNSNINNHDSSSYNNYNDNNGGYENEYAGLAHHDNQHYEHKHYDHHDHSYHPCEHSYTPEHFDDGFREGHFDHYGSHSSDCHKKSTFPKKHKHSRHH